MAIVRGVSHLSEGRVGDAHIHPHFHQCIYVRRGQARFRIADTDYDVSAPALLFISRLETHSFAVEAAEYDRYTVNIDPACPTGQARLFSVFTDRPKRFFHVFPLSGQEQDFMDLIFERMLRAYSSPDASLPDAADSYLTCALTELYRLLPDAFPVSAGGAADTVHRIKEILESRMQDPPTLRELGETLHLTPCYLAHLFKDATGYSIKRYALLCRLAAVRELLAGTDRSVTDICAQTGFSDISNLSCYFRREVGCTPTQYRRQIQQNSPVRDKEDPSGQTSKKE